MRLRNKPWAEDYLNEHPDLVVSNPEDYKGRWNELFGNDNPLHIEVGTGKGQFITGMAKANPNINYIGIELFDSVIVIAAKKAVEAGQPENLRLLNVNGSKLEEYFAKGDVSQVYLNFSDPWPKTRHAKRRLTHANFLSLYEKVLVDNGEIHFKTDNRGLFEFSLMSLTDYGMKLKLVSLDLHNDDVEDNIMTEYEEKFAQKGQPIYRVEVEFPDKRQKNK